MRVAKARVSNHSCNLLAWQPRQWLPQQAQPQEGWTEEEAREWADTELRRAQSWEERERERGQQRLRTLQQQKPPHICRKEKWLRGAKSRRRAGKRASDKKAWKAEEAIQKWKDRVGLDGVERRWRRRAHQIVTEGRQWRGSVRQWM